MKKIMIYTRKKGRGGFRFSRSPILSRAGFGTDVLCFSFLFCGSLLGCRIYSLFSSVAIIDGLARAPLTGDPWRLISTVLIRDVFFMITALFFGLCGIGTCVLILLPAAKGFFCALTVSFLIARFAARGFAYYGLILLPGDILSAVALVMLCIDGVSVSKKLGSVLLFGYKTDLDLKGFLFSAGRNMGLAVLGAILHGVCLKLFLRLF